MRVPAHYGLALVALLVAAPASAAQYVFNFNTSTLLIGAPVSGSGIFTTSDMAMIVGGRTAYAITGITGSVNGSPIVAPTATSYGNYFTTGATFLDGSGVNFNTAAGTRVAFFNQSSNGIYRVNTFTPGSSSFVNAVSAPVPEPAGWMTLIAGFAGIGLVLRRRRMVPRFA